VRVFLCPEIPLANLFFLPKTFAVQSSGIPYGAARLYFFQAGSTTPALVYQDILLATAHPQPVTATDQGLFPAIYLDPASTTNYRIQLKTSAGVLVYDQDDIPATELTQSAIALLLYPRSAAEVAASVTPTSYNYPTLAIERYGATSVSSDCTTAINNAFRVGEAMGNATVYSETGGRFIVLGSLTPDTSKVGFDGKGCHFDCTTKTSGDLWVPTNSDSDSLKRPGYNKAHTFENFTAKGPGITHVCRFLYLNDPSGLEVIAGLTFRNGASWDWETHVEYAIGAYFTAFENWDFTATTGGGGSNYFVKITSALQSGERNTFRECRFGVCQSTALLQTNGNATTFISQCSFNNSNGNFITTQGGKITATDCHWESQLDTAYWFGVEGVNTCLSIKGGVFVIAGNKSSYALAFCNSNVTAGRLLIFDVQFACSFTYTLPLVDGTGNTIVEKISSYQSGGQPRYYASAMNRLHNGTFETGSLTADTWTTSGGTVPTASNTNPRTGTYSLKVPGVNGQTNAAKVSTTCLPGQIVTGECYIAATAVTDGISLIAAITYLNNAGTTVLGSNFATITATQAYTRYVIGSYACAPAGTAKVELSITASGVNSGTPFGYLDDIILNVG
jgi:hypothetical protein